MYHAPVPFRFIIMHFTYMLNLLPIFAGIQLIVQCLVRFIVMFCDGLIVAWQLVKQNHWIKSNLIQVCVNVSNETYGVYCFSLGHIILNVWLFLQVPIIHDGNRWHSI